MVKSGVQAETELERVLHLLLPEQTALRGQPTSSSVGQDPLCQKLLEQAPEKLQEQLQQQAQSSGGSGPSSGTLFKSCVQHALCFVAAALVGHVCRMQDVWLTFQAQPCTNYIISSRQPDKEEAKSGRQSQWCLHDNN